MPVFTFIASLEKKDGLLLWPLTSQKLNILIMQVHEANQDSFLLLSPFLSSVTLLHKLCPQSFSPKIDIFAFHKLCSLILCASFCALFCIPVKYIEEKDRQTNWQTKLFWLLVYSVQSKERVWHKGSGLVLFVLNSEEDLITIHSYHFVRIVVILQPFSRGQTKRRNGFKLEY